MLISFIFKTYRIYNYVINAFLYSYIILYVFHLDLYDPLTYMSSSNNNTIQKLYLFIFSK